MRIFFFVFFLVFTAVGFGQNSTTLITINGEEISVDEFTRVYEKNRNIITTADAQSPEEYLDLFISYKLKVQEATALGYAEKPAYIKELKKYRAQLAQNFIKDTKVTDALVKEAHDRLTEEVNARHILISVKNDADTLQALEKIKEARSRIINGEDFTVVAKEMSEDPSVKRNGGELGWFKAFKMVYPFESAAYNTGINEVSKPFRTQFGYHIVQPTARRDASGSVEVAHIMITHKQADTTIIASQKIKEIYTLLEGGKSFGSLARAYSDDDNSAPKGGKLPAFEKGQLRSLVFEKAAFALKEKGAVSEPFRTDFGWHIIKLLDKKPVASYDAMRAQLTQKVTRDARSQVIDKTLRDKLRQRYGVGKLEEVKRYFITYVEADGTIELGDKSAEVAFKVNDLVQTYGDVLTHLDKKTAFKKRQNIATVDFVHTEVNRFVDATIKKYHLANLETVDQDFNALLREYREGLLLFELLDSKIWKVASSDSLGLQQFYEANKLSYDAASLDEIKGSVMSDYQKELEQLFVNDLKSKAKIKVEEKVLRSLSKRYEAQ